MKRHIAHSRMFRLSWCCLFALVGSSLLAQTPPTNVSVSPSSGSGLTQTFAFTSSSPSGYQAIGAVYALFNYGFDGSGSCYFVYYRSSNVIYIINDTGTAWSTAGNLGTGGTIENSQCALNLGASSYSGVSNNLTINLALTFKAGLPGAQIVYMSTGGTDGLSAPWQQMGTWTTSSVSSAPPTLVSATPTSGNGLSQTFSYVASSVNGYPYLVWMQMIFNSSLNGAGACYVNYNRLSNYIGLMNDAGNSLSTVALGTSGTLSNGQCSLNTGSSTASVSGNNLTLNLVITFNPSWAGAKNNYLYVYDRGNHTGGWQQMGTWTVGSGGSQQPLTIYSTGISSGGGLAGDGTVDSHYTLVSSADPSYPGPSAYVVTSNVFPIPPWMADGPNSKWIGPRVDAGGANYNAAGNYTYRTTFNLTGFNPATATLTGQFSADNGASIVFNGVTQGVTNSSFAAFTAFTINSGFVAGVNTLDFVVNNAGSSASPTGLRVEISGTASAVGVLSLNTEYIRFGGRVIAVEK